MFRKFWHATVPLAKLQGGPVPFRLLGEDLVLFLDAQGQPAALADRCCHRTARLGKGWVPQEGALHGMLQCGHHGWTYDRDARVVHIPQYAADRAIPADYRTPAYRCVARHGYAWVALEEPIAPVPDVPEFGAPGWRTIFRFHETWATSPLRALENSFDSSHFSFVHRATFGVADRRAPSRYELVEDDTGFHAETLIEAANPPAHRRVSGVQDAITTRHMRNAYFLPFSEEGLDVAIDGGNRSAASITRVASGAYDLCFGDISSLIEYKVANLGTPAVQAAYQYYNRAPFSIIGRRDRGITDFRSLARASPTACSPRPGATPPRPVTAPATPRPTPCASRRARTGATRWRARRSTARPHPA